tara:strand:- start:273 stop:512 length:240 start_codon:yes stop_codon:yes gene_type:complete
MSKKLTDIEQRKIILKAKIELSNKPEYTIRFGGGLGTTLWVNCGSDTVLSKELRKKIPSQFEGIRTLVVYSSDQEGEKK